MNTQRETVSFSHDHRRRGALPDGGREATELILATHAALAMALAAVVAGPVVVALDAHHLAPVAGAADLAPLGAGGGHRDGAAGLISRRAARLEVQRRKHGRRRWPNRYDMNRQTAMGGQAAVKPGGDALGRPKNTKQGLDDVVGSS